MNLRGIAASAATAAVILGTLGTPAHAEDPIFGVPVLSAEPTKAPDYKTKNCAGIADGKPSADAEGWRFGKPAGADEILFYIALYSTSLEDDAEIFPVLLDSDGLHSITADDLEDPEALAAAKKAAAGAAKKAAGAAEAIPGLPIGPAPAGFSGDLTDSGGWIRTKPNLWLVFAAAATEPYLSEGTFDLVSTCLVGVDTPTSPSPSPSSPAPSASPSPGPQLPVTGSNIPLVSGIGAGLVALGAVLFVVYRRRRTVKFVAE